MNGYYEVLTLYNKSIKNAIYTSKTQHKIKFINGRYRTLVLMVWKNGDYTKSMWVVDDRYPVRRQKFIHQILLAFPTKLEYCRVADVEPETVNKIVYGNEGEVRQSTINRLCKPFGKNRREIGLTMINIVD